MNLTMYVYINVALLACTTLMYFYSVDDDHFRVFLRRTMHVLSWLMIVFLVIMMFTVT